MVPKKHARLVVSQTKKLLFFFIGSLYLSATLTEYSTVSGKRFGKILGFWACGHTGCHTGCLWPNHLGNSNETSFAASDLVQLLPLHVVLLHVNLLWSDFYNQDRCTFYIIQSTLFIIMIIMFTSTTLLDLLELSLRSLLLPRLWSCSTFCTIHILTCPFNHIALKCLF